MFDDIIKIEISASIIAWYAAIVATISFVLKLLDYLRDKAKIKVKISQGFLVYSGNLGDEININIEAINMGRRTVTLNGIGFLLNDGNHFILPQPKNIDFPYELHEGKSILTYIKKKELLEGERNRGVKIKYAWYRDMTGKIYKAKYKIK